MSCSEDSGNRLRTVSCVGCDWVLYNDSFCGNNKPSTSTSCTDETCDATEPSSTGSCTTYTYGWSTGPWSTCSGDSTWTTSAWSACSESCGSGLQTRTVSCDASNGTQTRVAECFRCDGTVASDSSCGTTPSTSQTCNGVCTGNEPSASQSCTGAQCPCPSYLHGPPGATCSTGAAAHGSISGTCLNSGFCTLYCNNGSWSVIDYECNFYQECKYDPWLCQIE